MPQNIYKTGSRGLEKTSNRLGYGFSALGNMVIGPAVRTITLPYSDTPRAVEVVPTTEENLAVKVVIEYTAHGAWVVLTSVHSPQKVRRISLVT